MAEALPISEAKTRLSELADRIERQHERIVVTRHGRPSFVLMSPDEIVAPLRDAGSCEHATE